ncbi:tRNA pseudouridine38-40 synthase [Arboricoccus pini]|uniref:tRNA pseudouridine synthase A n=1 Tax=Arboricoccus pini TaxID=1963835 RepID=A0A212QX92_9PROT|nr:tRNA pseudouridine(38-40) synthase TruA [Arboricoccus pini]SNB64368.1 tRNA pseudouridine38-40 synthase [Arboricoccus pini]
MPRYRLTIEYDGIGFHGWQIQAGLPTVQAALETALFAITGDPTPVTGSGRTDTGVHALGQVAHLDTRRDWTPDRLMGALNAHLRPQPISVLRVEQTHPQFHARFDARRRRYRYRILNRRAPPALATGRLWHRPQPLAADLMHAAAQALVGRHDFTSFRAAECQAKSPLRTLDLIHVHRQGEEILIDLAARSFLHHQVRNIVGTLVPIGQRLRPVAHMAEVLAARNRVAAGQTAPPDGLYLVDIAYEERT